MEEGGAFIGTANVAAAWKPCSARKPLSSGTGVALGMSEGKVS